MPFALPGFFRTLGFDPASLSPVIWFDMDTSMLAAGDVAATEGDLVATLENKVSGGPDATQTVSSEQALAKIPIDGNQPYLLMDLVDDEYEFTTGSAVNGTIVAATLEGTYSANISLSASTQYDLQARGVAATANGGLLKNSVGYLITPTQLTDAEITNIEAYFVDKGAAARSAFGSVADFYIAWYNCSSLTSFPLIDTSSGTSFNQAWRNCSSLTSFPLINTSSGTNFSNTWRDCSSLTSFPLIDTSSGTNFAAAWYNCTSLTSFPLIVTSSGTDFNQAWYNCTSLTSFPLIDTSLGANFTNAWRNCTSLTSFPLINTSSGTNFYQAWSYCTSLTSFPANFFDNWSPASISSGVFTATWDGCLSLTAQSVENILVSIDASGIYGTDTGLSGGTQLADHTIAIDYDGTTLSSATTTAIANLKTKDWAININGVPIYGTSISGSASGSNILHNGVAPAVSGASYRVRFTASNVSPRGRVRYRNYAGGADVSVTSGLGSLNYFTTDGDYESIIPADDGLSIWIYSEPGQSWDYSGFSVQQI